ncbi:MAG: hypothetical protein CVV64_19650 [Candidatus Wallbacteria bacterium HGW-Wallbacteria-1]|jgi:NAD-dependent SIR2 family protein deacetylase|uniref:Uncharacterized protein n=1 Tax=Candidatus Wallbacteria bacterium HGW-Wallbacteria-1 TaxID=2013854 RepID=A0A2N1PIW8_9BACT|nr:MAG: hypothetical protein CVV64_19650 [Candidatus Wallbacteria bacterium HGW-Wallbacteria-1]
MKEKKDDKLEKLTTIIQKKLDGNPVILVGSGGSIPYGLPSMKDLADKIFEELNDKYSTDESWKDFIVELETSNNLEYALEKIELNENIHHSIISVIWKFIDQADRKAITSFLKTVTTPAISLILKKFVQQTGTTNIITTNYDRVIEYAIDAVQGNVRSGFQGDCVKTFGFTSERNNVKRCINLFKVHGSIDWFRHKENFNLVATNFYDQIELADSYDAMIVTPGNGKYKETHNDPFRTVMAEADKALRNSPSYLCVGYGFNDEHIQPIIIDENRNKTKPIVIVTKDVTQKMEELFLTVKDSNCIILSENSGGGTMVRYSKSDSVVFDEEYWKLDQFYKLWLE